MERPDRLERLVEIMARLRAPDGCPWDREQDWSSLRTYLVEESYEVAEALDRGDRAALCEELGDLLFQIVFLSRLGEEEGAFSIGDVIAGIAEKLVRRHPHVFGSARADTAAEVARNWERIKREEKGAERSLLDGVPRALPALLGAQRLGDKAALAGFDWDDARAVRSKVGEEIAELDAALEAGQAAAMTHELGDALFSLAMLARHAGVDAEAALAAANRRFRSRFAHIEAELRSSGEELGSVPSERLEQLWAAAKRRETRD